MRELHEECGVLGIYGVEHAPHLAFLALQALQHRGQQGCGMVVAADNGSLQIHKGAGLVKDVFKEEDLARLSGSTLIGSSKSVEEIREFIGADTLNYLSEEALFRASGRTSLCTACFSGHYPTDLYGHEE